MDGTPTWTFIFHFFTLILSARYRRQNSGADGPLLWPSLPTGCKTQTCNITAATNQLYLQVFWLVLSLGFFTWKLQHEKTWNYLALCSCPLWSVTHLGQVAAAEKTFSTVFLHSPLPLLPTQRDNKAATFCLHVVSLQHFIPQWSTKKNPLYHYHSKFSVFSFWEVRKGWAGILNTLS